ncbi:NAD(+) synthase [Pedosphaera parvula]|uniref:Glutamine-dependent NAD(+) synthetase n=1 Tax=Pedosphaera parvula (strain Ellin514) TaxID=320771 RepID=B9XDY4_PEDPL|nr:NAD(+) synthase [Pedosphaera parvula]EEF61875.1 NAD+ synthetase [Pedosphaera parvula Ellin514]
MKLIKVAAAVLNQTPLDWPHNKQNILAAIDTARAQHVSVLCLPELCVTGYGCEDAFQSANTQRMAWRMLQEILVSTRGMIVSLGLPIFHQNNLFNCACLISNGKILGFVAKKFLAGDGIHYEPRWFKPWPSGVRNTLTTETGETFPIGDLYFDCGGLKIGFEICEDAWAANRPGAALALHGVDMILNPSASHFAFGKIEIRKRFVLEGSRAFGVTYIYANLLGNEAGRAIYDGGALIASAGKLLAEGNRFSFADFQITTALIDVDITRMAQARLASLKPQLEEAERGSIRAPFVYPPLDPQPTEINLATWENSLQLKAEEFTRAEALALFDYLRKSRSQGFVVSLSGGVDSATVSCLVAIMVHLGIGELGLETFVRKLDYIPNIADRRTPRELIKRLLTCVYQSTANSSETTREAAKKVAKALGAQFLEFDVEHLREAYVAIASKALGRELNWAEDDIALQNVQARVRSPGVWLLVNVQNALLLSTSNRSEAAVGYATMDGDTSGGLSPIAGIDKAFLQGWLRWLEREGPIGFGAIPALAAVNCQTPTAELRPQESSQTDEADLMPYPVLDAIERAGIRDKQSPLEIYRLMRVQFPQYTGDQMFIWVDRFFRLWSRNQWKRERYAPSFHLDDENLDPKTWCRFPILSGGFATELLELRDYVTREKSNEYGK